MPFELYKNTKGKFGFRLKAGNGQIVLASELYETKAKAKAGIKSVVTYAGKGASSFEHNDAKDGRFYFNLKARNGNVIGTSQMYKSEAARKIGIASVMKNAPDAMIKDLS